MVKLPSVQYPAARPTEGYWGDVTSTINWCEEDYYATIYAAEIVNTLTNLLFLVLGTKGLLNCLKYKHDTIFAVSFAGYLAVGAGSFAFHSTLKYPMQLVDELSMIYTTSLMCYATFSFSQSRLVRQILGVSLAALAIFITLYYHYLQDPKFHQNCFTTMTIVILSRAMYLMEANLRPSLRKKYATVPQQDTVSQSERATNLKRDEKILKEMWGLVGMGMGTFITGAIIWQVDNRICSDLRYWRHEIGLPWGLLLEGHGWWHIFTGIGSYIYLVWGIWLRHCLNGRQAEFKLNWPSLFSIPEVVARDPLPGQSKHVQNGRLNGLNGKAKRVA